MAVLIVAPLCLAVVVGGIVLLGQRANTASVTTIIAGTYELNGGSRDGFNYFHMEGYGAKRPDDSPAADFWQDTFCTHKDYSSAPGTYVYYYNASPDETAQGNPLFINNVLNQGTSIKSGLVMTVAQWRDLRYCILYTNVNRDSFGQYAYWSYLATKIPESYSGMSGRATWQDAWMTQYFGAKASDDFMGLGSIAEGDSINIGAQVGVELTYNGSATVPANFSLDASTPRVGPFKVTWTPGSDPTLAQLDCGPDKTTAPLFNLAAAGSAVRFYSSPASKVPVTAVRLGDEFYIEYNANAASSGEVDVTATAANNLITDVLADQFFIHPCSQNQTNVDTNSSRPKFDILVTVPEKDAPLPSDIDYSYVRPTVTKQVAQDNHLNASGDYQDVLNVAPGTDVIHKMTVTSTDPKGTILTFQNTAYDLYPSSLNYPTIYNASGAVYNAANASAGDACYDSADGASRTELTLPANTALVYNAAQFKAAIDANKNIKQMSDITIPASWTASTTIYTGIFDGNGFVLKGDGATMTCPVFYKTNAAVFYRVSFTGFKMARSVQDFTATSTTLTDPTLGNGDSVGTLVDYFGDSTPATIGKAVPDSVSDLTAPATAQNAPADFTAKMIDCYVQGSLTYNYNGPNNYSGNVSCLNNFAGGVAGNVYGAEVYGVKALVSVNTTNAQWNRDNYTGAMFGRAVVNTFENNELMKGSVLNATTAFVGGMICRSSTNGNPVRNCVADYEYSNIFAGNHPENCYFGGLFQTSGSTLYDRCSVKVKYGGYYYGNGAYDSGTQRATTQFGGMVSVDAAFSDTITVSNCSAVYTGLPVLLSGADGQAGLFRSGNNNTFVFENCYSSVDMDVTDGGAAEIYARSAYASASSPVTIKNCVADGTITVSGNSVVAGIALGGPSDSQTGAIENCTSAVAFNIIDNTVRAGGIWANADDHNSGAVKVMTISDCLFSNTMAVPGSGALNSDIYSCLDGVCVGVNNYTVNVGTDLSGPDGLAIDQETLGSTSGALSFFRDTLNWGSALVADRPDQDGKKTPAFYLYNAGTESNPYYLPALATDYRWPAQRIYVTDYYDQNNAQETLQDLYIWNGSAFVSLWDAGTKVAGTDASDPSAAVDFTLSGSTFTFYYFVGDTSTESKASGQDGAWQNTGAWQNRVNITPRDNVLSFPGATGDKDYSKPSLDWPGATDDDWVLCDKDFPAIQFNLIKMTTLSNYPMPLDGCEFKLYRSDSIYSDLSGVDLGDGSWKLAATLDPTDYIGLDSADQPVITAGSYVLVESGAPANYTDNIGARWYLIFSGGQLRMYSDAALKNEISLGEDQGVLPDYPNTLIYAAHVENNQNTDTPHARISIVKWDDNGNKIIGQTKTVNGSQQFSGAVYGLRKYTGDNWTGTTFDYGNMLVYGSAEDGTTMLQNWDEIEPGYYELIEIRAPQGYVTDPTPIYINFDPAAPEPLTFNTATHNVASRGLDATVSINASNPFDATVNVKDPTPQYKITLHKFNATDRSAIDGVNFQLINAVDKSIVATYTTSGADAAATVTIPATPDGVWILREALSGTQLYAPIPDYTIELRSGELFVKGGPDNYNFKLVHGERDNSYYVISDPDGTAVPLDAGSYPVDFTLDQNDALVVGLIHATFGVPNTPAEGAEAVISGTKVVKGTAAPDDETFRFKLTQVADAQGAPYASAPITGDTSRKGPGDFSFDAITLRAGTWYFKISEIDDGSPGWSYDGSNSVVRVVVSDDPLTAKVYYPVASSLAPGVRTTPHMDYATVTDDLSCLVQPGMQPYNAIVLKNADGNYNANCLDRGIPDPTDGLAYTKTAQRDNDIVSLIVALSNSWSSGLDNSDSGATAWKNALGITTTISDADRGDDLSNALAQVYQWRDHDFPAPLYPAMKANDPTTWPKGSSVTNKSGVATDYLTQIRSYELNKANVFAAYTQESHMLEEMMTQYSRGEETSLVMNWLPDSATSATITFAHQGFVPHTWDSSADGDKTYNTRLTWTGAATVTVNGGAPVSDGTAGVPVRETDTITVTGISASTTFALTDSTDYLVPGSIKGALYEYGDSPTTVQRLQTGYALFTTLKCTLAPGSGADDITFTNAYAAGPALPYAGGPGTAPFMIAAAILSALLAAGLLYYRHERRRVLTM